MDYEFARYNNDLPKTSGVDPNAFPKAQYCLWIGIIGGVSTNG